MASSSHADIKRLKAFSPSLVHQLSAFTQMKGSSGISGSARTNPPPVSNNSSRSSDKATSKSAAWSAIWSST